MLASAVLLVLVLPVMADYEDEEDLDMEMLLEVMKRTRPKPTTAYKLPSFAGDAEKLTSLLRGTEDKQVRNRATDKDLEAGNNIMYSLRKSQAQGLLAMYVCMMWSRVGLLRTKAR